MFFPSPRPICTLIPVGLKLFAPLFHPNPPLGQSRKVQQQRGPLRAGHVLGHDKKERIGHIPRFHTLSPSHRVTLVTIRRCGTQKRRLKGACANQFRQQFGELNGIGFVPTHNHLIPHSAPNRPATFAPPAECHSVSRGADHTRERGTSSVLAVTLGLFFKFPVLATGQGDDNQLPGLHKIAPKSFSIGKARRFVMNPTKLALQYSINSSRCHSPLASINPKPKRTVFHHLVAGYSAN